MTPIRIITATTCGLGLAACSSSFDMAPKWENLDMKPTTIPLKVDSNPPGAEARAPKGIACRTPCTLELPVMNEPFEVSYTLNGYAPQTMSIRPVMPAQSMRGLPFYLPDPAVAQLSPAAAPPPPKPQAAPPKKKRPVATAAAPAPAAQAANATQAAPAAPNMDAPKPYPYPPPPQIFTPIR